MPTRLSAQVRRLLPPSEPAVTLADERRAGEARSSEYVECAGDNIGAAEGVVDSWNATAVVVDGDVNVSRARASSRAPSSTAIVWACSTGTGRIAKVGDPRRAFETLAISSEGENTTTMQVPSGD